MKKTTMLRKLLKQPGLLVIPCAYDCLSARMAQGVGFKVLFMSGHAIRDTQLGLPDIGIATATEVVGIIKNMVDAIDVPLMVDGDDGYGGALSAYRTTQEVIRVGAAGMFIDDQIHPTKGPSIGGQKVLPRDEYLGKLGAALEARNKEDKDFVLVARTDAASAMGVEEMVARAKACIKLGADMVLPQPTKTANSKKELKQFYKAMGAPEVMIWGSGPAEFTAKDYEEIGAKIWVPGNPLPAVAKTLIELYKGLYDTGTLKSFSPPGIPTRAYLNQVAKLDFWNDLEKKYVP